MQDFFGSVRRSLAFNSPPLAAEEPTSTSITPPSLVDRISSSVRRSRVFSTKPYSSPPPPTPPPIRWRKGELIGCGASGHVYMGMNLDSGELLAVKQVLIPSNGAIMERTQDHIKGLEEEVKLLKNLSHPNIVDHIKGLEEEVKLLKNLSHPNIVRYLGTVREEESLNILLEFVPGGSISSLLGKFGSFPEPVIRSYTEQLLQGLEYLHSNGIMHRDIKGANILVDNKGCIKLADFGASKQVVELATITGAKSMKGTVYWMAPEVILQTGHSCSADIWSVGCTVIEMATGKPPWSQQYQEVAAFYFIGSTKSHPEIPEHLSAEAKDFLLRCLQKEPNMRPDATNLLQHPFITGKFLESHPVIDTLVMENSEISLQSHPTDLNTLQMSVCPDTSDVCNFGSLSYSTDTKNPLESKLEWRTNNRDEDMCQIDKDDFTAGEIKLTSGLNPYDFNQSCDSMCELSGDWRNKFSASFKREPAEKNSVATEDSTACPRAFGKEENSLFPFASSLSEDDDELTESKIRAFLDEKAFELKKLQTPLYVEFYNSLNEACSPNFSGSKCDETSPNYSKLPPKSRSPKLVPVCSPSAAVGAGSPGSNSRRVSNIHNVRDHSLHENLSPLQNDQKGSMVDAHQESSSPSVSFSERQRKWKEELDQELERKREMMRLVGVGGKSSSPKDRALNRQRTRFASPGR